MPQVKTRKSGTVVWQDSPWQILWRALTVVVTTVLVLAAVVIFVIPWAVGGQALTVLSPSMEPALRPGDVAVVRGIDPADACHQINVGDVITFMEEGMTIPITHRVIATTVGSFPDGSSCRFATQGDNNNTPDSDLVSPAQVRGVFMYGIPYVGWARQWVTNNQTTVVVAIVVVVAGSWLWASIRGPKTRVISTAAVSTTAVGQQQASGLPVEMPPQAPVAPVPAVPPPPTADDHSYQLRRQELALRERELALREAEARHKFGYSHPSWEDKDPQVSNPQDSNPEASNPEGQ